MGAAVEGLDLDTARGLWTRVGNLVTPEGPEESTDDDLSVLKGLRAVPARKRCATLPWQTLREIVPDLQNTASLD